MKKINLFFPFLISSMILGSSLLLCTPPSQASTEIGMRNNEIMPPELNKTLQLLLDLKRRNQMEGIMGEEPSEDEEVNVDNNALSMILPESVVGDIRRMKERVEALVRFNQGRKGGASFGLAMIGIEGGSLGGKASETKGEGKSSPRLEVKTAEPIKDAELSDDTPLLHDGDMNGDGVFDLKDAVLITRIAYGLRQGTEEELAKADLNQDGQVDKWDAFLGTMVLAGVLTMDEAKGATLDSLGINYAYGNGNGGGGSYSRTKSYMDPKTGTLYIEDVSVGEDPEEIKKRLERHLRRLIKLMARLMGAKSAGEGTDEEIEGIAAELSLLYQNFDRYLMTGQLPLY